MTGGNQDGWEYPGPALENAAMGKRLRRAVSWQDVDDAEDEVRP